MELASYIINTRQSINLLLPQANLAMYEKGYCIYRALLSLQWRRWRTNKTRRQGRYKTHLANKDKDLQILHNRRENHFHHSTALHQSPNTSPSTVYIPVTYYIVQHDNRPQQQQTIIVHVLQCPNHGSKRTHSTCLLNYTEESDQAVAQKLETPDDGSVWAETYVGLSDILS